MTWKQNIHNLTNKLKFKKYIAQQVITVFELTDKAICY